MKTEIDIKDDLYRHLATSGLVAEVNGELTKSARDPDSRAEDVVIAVVASDAEGDTLEAILNVNIYVASYTQEGRKRREPSDRLRTLSRLALEALTIGTSQADGYRFTLSRQRILHVDATGEYVINNRIIYQSLK